MIMPKKAQLKPGIKLYYALIVLVLLFQTLATVIKLSQTIAYQHRISALQTQKQQLIQQNEEVEVQLGKLNSLVAVKEKAVTQYIPISAVVVLPADQSLALKL